MAADLGLNDHHQQAIVNYIRFARFQRVQCLRTVSATFKDVANTRLTDDTFTKDEVEELLKDLETLIRSEVESELINTSHTNAILLRQLFQQAEQWHLKLMADTAQLENSELLRQIKDFEEEELLGKARDKPSSPVRTKLEPINESAATQLLNKKIDELINENKIAEENRKQAEMKAVTALKEKSVLSEQLNVVYAELNLLRAQQTTSADGTKSVTSTSSFEVEEMQKQLQDLQSRISSIEFDPKEKALEEGLAQSQHELLKVKMQLETAQQELEKNFNQTAAYNNLKKMLLKKNEQIKTLRKLITNYEPNIDYANID